MYESVNPTTGELIERYDQHDEDEVEHRLARAWTTAGDWRASDLPERSQLLEALADRLEQQRDDLAELMTTEMGKPITAARSEVDKCAWVCRHYAEHGPGHLEPEVVETDARRSHVQYDPLGPVLAIMPWNFPLWQVFRHVAPSVMVGNSILLKHAPNVTGCALAIEELLVAAGAPEKLVQVLLVDDDTAAEVIADDRVRGVTLTGSVRAGRAVASQAGQHLKKTVLELGGSDAFIVLEDADLEQAAEIGATSRLINNGESCIAAKRFLVEEAVADDFTDLLTSEIRDRTVGDPMHEDTDIGPMARADLRDDLDRQVAVSVEQGASVVLGGAAVDRPGFYYEPTVLTGVVPTMPAGAEETFGPAAAVIRCGGVDEAVALANASDYGLGASIWTEDRDRGAALATRVEAGCVFVNQLVKSDPRVPFGGVKDSGYGRELGRHGIREFTNTKTVWIE